MDFRMRISLFCCLAACVFMVAVPLVSEATYRGRGSEAGKPFDTQIIYVDTLPPETESPDGEESETAGGEAVDSETVSPAPDASAAGRIHGGALPDR